MGEAVLRLISSPALFFSLLSFFGVKSFHDKFKDDIPNLFGDSSSDVIKIGNDWSDDTRSSNPAPSISGDLDDVIKVGDDESENIDNIDDVVKIGEMALQNLLKKSEVSSNSVPDISSAIDTISIPLPEVNEGSNENVNTDNLLGVLKANNLSLQNVINDNFAKLLQVLGVLSNTLTSIAVSNSVTLPKIVNEISLLRGVLNDVGLAIVSLAERPVVVKSTPQVNVENNVETPTINNNIDIQSLVDVLSDKLGVVAQAKELEKEHYEFMKTPKSYNVESVANSVPNISPREAIALNNLVNSHLLSQEATLTGEDLDLDDYDFDFSDVIAKLFNFKGISEDVRNLGGDNGS